MACDMIIRGNKSCKNRQKLYKILCSKNYCTKHYNKLRSQIFILLPVEIIEIIMKRVVDVELNARIPVKTIFNFALCSKQMQSIFRNIRMYVIRCIPIWKSIYSNIPIKDMLVIKTCVSEELGCLESMRKIEKCDGLNCYFEVNDDVFDMFNFFDRDVFENGFDVEGDGFFSEPHLNMGIFKLSSTKIIDIHLCSVIYGKTMELVVEFSDKNMLFLIMNKNNVGYYSIYTNRYKSDTGYDEKASQCYFECIRNECPYKDRHYYTACPGPVDIFAAAIAVDLSPLETPYMKSNEVFCENAYDIACILNTITNYRICNIVS